MRAALVAIFCTALLGCGSDLASVTGTVTLDGKPLACNEKKCGTVQFSPEGGHGRAASGALDENGKYHLSSGSQAGVLPGKYSVSIWAQEIIPNKIPGGAPGGRLVTPEKYGDIKKSGFTADVVRGSNTFDYALSSDKPR
jgi:hypothetical protein